MVSINPYKDLEIFSDNQISRYREKKRSELEPHLYALAQDAYQTLLHLGESQAVIISGESGAGKTEATKIILKFLTVAAGSSHRGNLLDLIPYLPALFYF